MKIQSKYLGKGRFENTDTARRMLSKVSRMVFILAVGLVLAHAYAGGALGQGPRGFLLFGDLSINDTRVGAAKPLVTEVILYTKTLQVIGRERVSGGRFRFADIPAGDYWLVLELDGTERFRDSVFIANSSVALDVRHDLKVLLRPAGVSEDVAGVVNFADLYERSSANKVLYKRAKQEMEAKSYKEAIATLNQITAADRADYWSWSDLGMLYFLQKDYEAAEKSYAGALAAKADHFPALLNQGRVQMARTNYEAAAATLEAALKADPKSASANLFLGETYLQLKKGSKAVVNLNAAIALDPVGMADAHLRLGALYNGANLKDRAAAEYEAFLKVKPDYQDRKKLEDYIAANKKP